MELKETASLMTSKNYKDRFVAEYAQTEKRNDSLVSLIYNYKQGKLDFEPDCPISLLEAQSYVMECYLAVLRIRAEIENVNLERVYK